MSEIKKYVTVRESNFKDLDKAVNEKIKEGWQPFGGPYVTDGNEFLACQAMVSMDDNESASLPTFELPDFSKPSEHEEFNRMIQGLPSASS